MLFIISDKYLLISVINDSNDCNQLALYDIKLDSKSPTIVDFSEMKPKIDNNGANNDANEKKEAKSSESDGYSLTCGAFGTDSKFLAVCDNKKQLMIFGFNEKTNAWTLFNKKKLIRNCFKVLFSLSRNSVLCADKSGDVYEIGDTDQSLDSCLLLGHCSMLRDMTLTNDSKYLITCDRDEKIRVSHYPNAYNIESFCLGHKEFVSSVALIDNQTLVSGSGDGSIRLWNLSDGKELMTFMCDSNEVFDNKHEIRSKFAVKKLIINKSIDSQLIAVSFYKQSIVNIYSIKLTPIDSISLDAEPIDIQFDYCKPNCLWLLLPVIDNPLNVYQITNECSKKENLYQNIVNELNNNSMFQKSCFNANNSDELEGLYKHWFNNVESYLQKKEEREELTKKKKIM